MDEQPHMQRQKFFLGLLLLINFAYSDALAALDVMHYDSNKHIWEKQLIFNMGNMKDRSIISAGKYAWAMSDTTVAFYNGTNWEPGVVIPGMKNLKNIYPAYPLTGKLPVAWAIGGGDDSAKMVSYFDGKKWSNTKYLPDSQYGTLIGASNGHIWAIGNNRYRDAIISTDIKHPEQWSTPTPLEIGGSYSPYVFSYDDHASYIYLLEFGKHKLIRIDENNKVYEKSFEQYVDGILAREGQIAVIATNFENQTIFYSNNNGISWRSFPFIIENVPPLRSMYHGLICGEIVDRGNNIIPGKFACLDMTQKNPQWQEFESNDKSQTMVITDANGAWLISQTKVQHYDIKTKTLSDLHLETIANSVTWRPPIGSVINNQFVTAAIDKYGQWIGIVSTANGWESISIPWLNESNSASISGDYDNPLYATNDNDEWIYQY